VAFVCTTKSFTAGSILAESDPKVMLKPLEEQRLRTAFAAAGIVICVCSTKSLAVHR
jgi:hypothetical protein